MAKITLVGDVHGKIPEYQELLSWNIDKPVIQLGDMGCGFLPIPKFSNNHQFIRGNHDSPSVAQSHPNYLGEFGYIKPYNMFFLGGAFSIDFQMRHQWMAEGGAPCWWSDEELSPIQLNQAMNIYTANKPRIVVSHEAPALAGLTLLQMEQKRLYKFDCTASRTAQALQQMFDQHQPDLWVFGHYHFSRNFKLNGTRFLCLNELEAFELDTEKPLEKFYD